MQLSGTFARATSS